MEVALRLRRVWIVLPLTVAAMLLACGRALGSETAADLGVVTLFDGERGETLNTWGGGWGVGSMRTIEIQSAHVHSGRFALGAELGPTPPGGDRCLQCFASGFGPSKAYCQTRDLSRFARLEFYVQNAAHAALNGTLQVKDYHDSSRHRAVYRFYLPASSRAPEWQHVVVPLLNSRSRMDDRRPSRFRPCVGSGLHFFAGNGTFLRTSLSRRHRARGARRAAEHRYGAVADARRAHGAPAVGRPVGRAAARMV